MRVVIVFTSMLLAAIPVLAADAQAPSSLEAAEALDPAKIAIGMDIFDLTMGNGDIQQAMQSLPAPPAAFSNPRAQAAVDQTVQASRQHAADIVQEMRPRMRQLYAEAYARHFSLEELKSLKTFYATGVGKKLAAEQPALTREVINVLMPEMLAKMAPLWPAPKVGVTPLVKPQ